MVNIGEKPLPAPAGLVTSVGFSAFGKTYFGYEGNIYSTGATLKWICDQPATGGQALGDGGPGYQRS